MTTGTIHTFDPARSTGTLCCMSGTLVPFSTRDGGFRAGDRVTFRLTGGIAGLYAKHVEHASVRVPARPAHQVMTSRQVFRSPVGASALLAG